MTYRKRGTVVPEVSSKENPAAYMRLYRARSPKHVERERRVNSARHRALEALARRHDDEFLRLYKRHLKREGLG